MDLKKLGQRIRYFRQRRNITQFDLELEIGCSSGMISRIEIGKVNPTKETLLKIAHFLNLNSREIDYIIGVMSQPASDQEISGAKQHVSEYFSKKGVLAYLIDDRWRFLEVSDYFVKTMQLTRVDADKLIGRTIVEILLNDDLGIVKFFTPEKYHELIEFQLSHFFNEVNFMFDDEYHLKSLEAIMQNKFAKEVWTKFAKNPPAHVFNPKEQRVVDFKIAGFDVPMHYSREPITTYPRFEVIEYTPTNMLIKALTKLGL